MGGLARPRHPQILNQRGFGKGSADSRVWRGWRNCPVERSGPGVSFPAKNPIAEASSCHYLGRIRSVFSVAARIHTLRIIFNKTAGCVLSEARKCPQCEEASLSSARSRGLPDGQREECALEAALAKAPECPTRRCCRKPALYRSPSFLLSEEAENGEDGGSLWPEVWRPQGPAPLDPHGLVCAPGTWTVPA